MWVSATRLETEYHLVRRSEVRCRSAYRTALIGEGSWCLAVEEDTCLESRCLEVIREV